MNAEDIAALIRSGLPEAEVEVRDSAGDGNHFEALVVCPTFAGKGLVERHQQVYASLKGAMANRIHALALRTLTPDEWARER